MRARLLLSLSLLLSLPSALVRAQQVAPAVEHVEPLKPEAGAPDKPVAELSVRDSIVLGLVEGITEFLPVSSTGHLVIADHALGLESEAPLRDGAGNSLWYKKPSPKHPGGIPLTIKLAADTYIVIIQIGAIAAVVFLYWGQLIGMLRGLLGQNAAGVRLLRNLIIAVLPAGILGLALKDWIDDHLFSVPTVIVALVSGAVLMFGAERWRRDQPKNLHTDPADLNPRQAFGIGVMQCLALWPGMSRSMVTMVGGYFCGLTPAKAAEFSFLVGLPTLAGAALLKGWSTGHAMVQVFGLPHMILGGVVAAVSAAIAVKFLVTYLSRHGLGLFAIYRVLLAVLLAAWFFV